MKRYLIKRDNEFFIESSELDVMHLDTGDQVRCVHSTVEGRKGTVYTVSRSSRISKLARAKGHAELWWLKHCESYGDKFEKVDTE